MAFSEMSFDTRRLADRLIEVPHGETVSYDQLRAAVGFDVRHYRYKLSAAMRIAIRETGAAFVSVRGVGYRRITEDRLADDVGRTARARVRRTARRANNALSHALRYTNGMDNDTTLKVLREQSALGLLVELSQDRRLPKVANHDQRPLTPAQCAALLVTEMGIG